MVGLGGIVWVAPVALSALVTAALAGYAWKRHSEPGTTAFAALMVTTTVWSAGYALGLVTTDPGLRKFWLYVEWTVIPLVPVAWLAFALAYAGWGHLLTRRLLGALSVLPLVTVVLAWTNPWHRLVWATNEVVVEGGVVLTVQSFGPWFGVNVVYAYVLLAIGTGILLKPVVGDDPLYTDQSIALSIGAVVPWVANVVSALGLAPLEGLDLTPYAFAVTGIGFGLALFRFELLDVVPALQQLGRDVAISDLQDGVIVLDRDGRVRDLNPAAAAMVGHAKADVLGEHVETVLGVDPVAADRDRVQFAAPNGRRTLETSVSPVEDQHGRVIAYTLVVRDVTERETREQRLSVLNRVLRHNVRNDLSVVTVYADHLADRVPPEDREMVATIAEQSSGLVDVAQKARQAEDMMADVGDTEGALDVERVAEAVCRQVGSRYSDCEIAVDAAAERVALDRSVVEQVLLNLVENAAEHNDAEDPRVEVAATLEPGPDGDWLRLAVADNGPGIPDQERVAIDTDREDPLRHGSSIGLWLVNWGVDRLGGTLDIADNDPCGAIVTVRIPV